MVVTLRVIKQAGIAKAGDGCGGGKPGAKSSESTPRMVHLGDGGV